MFTKKIEALKAKEMIQVQSAQLVVAVVEACKIVPELHIREEAPLKPKIRKLPAGVHDAKVEVARV